LSHCGAAGGAVLLPWLIFIGYVLEPNRFWQLSISSLYGRLLPPRRERPCCGGAAEKCDEFPSPHGFARAEDTIGYEKNITFLDLQ
jgi:hypothetical protein